MNTYSIHSIVVGLCTVRLVTRVVYATNKHVNDCKVQTEACSIHVRQLTPVKNISN